MSRLAPLLAAIGAVLLFSGLPRSRSVAALTRPFLTGISGSAPMRIRAVGPGSDVADRLRSAGVSIDVDRFRLEQFSWAAIAATAAATVAGLLSIAGAAFSPAMVVALTFVAGAAGYVARDRWLTVQVDTRRQHLVDELPAAIDLLTLAIMSGSSVPAAFARVAAVMPSGIGEEFRAVVADQRAGDSVVVALERLRSRVPDPQIARLVDALLVAIDRGSPLAEVLRAQADDCREAKRRRLLEMGGRREILMLIPIVFLIMPVIVVFALLPGLVTLDLLVP